MRLIVPPPSDLDVDSDEDLLLAVAAGDSDERNRAANAFFRRYVEPLYEFCRQFRNTLEGDDGVSYLVLRTFERAFDHAETYCGEGIQDRAHSEARTFRWLTTIADRLLKDWLKSPNEANPVPLSAVGKTSHDGAFHGVAVDLDEHALTTDGNVEGPAASPPVGSPEESLLRAALDTLSEREREIVLLSARYLVPGRQLRVDGEDLDELCRRWRTKPENVRAIRCRALRKIREYVGRHATT